MRVSVICNTYNRGEHLRRLLVALSKQTYEDFEVVVVNGPSTDCTGDVIEEFRDAIVVADCPEVNLSVSRNIGIRAAAGEILAFIDDDAVPGHSRWLENLVSYYDDPEVGGVGGAVYRLYGQTEFKDGYVDAFGDASSFQEHTCSYNDPKGERFSYIQGCNCSFRRDVLAKIDGFNEYFEYFHEESDVAVRVIKNGWKILTHPDAPVFHEAAGGHTRKSQFHLNWYVIVKNQVYFGIMNSDHLRLSLDARIDRVLQVAKKRLNDFDWMQREEHISRQDYEAFVDMWQRGVEQGLRDGLAGNRKLMPPLGKVPAFQKFRKEACKHILSIALVCENFDLHTPKDGIASYTARLAKDFRSLGHCVHVITDGKHPAFRMEDGINIHTVLPRKLQLQSLHGKGTVQRILDFSSAVFEKTMQLKQVFGLDIIESPLWNVPGIITSYMSKIPVCIRMETPLRKVVETHQWEESEDIRFIEKMEAEYMRHADGILYISDAIQDTIKNMYRIEFLQPSQKNYLGISLTNRSESLQDSQQEKDAGIALKIFFIGRLERRKGIQNLLEAIPAVLEAYPNAEFRIAGDDLIVDSVTKKTWKNYFKEAVPKSVQERVVFLGNIGTEEKEWELEHCDMFVAPSLYESFGIVFLEAMRHAKPVIGCKAGGMKEVIENGVTGLLAAPGDTQDLTRCILALAKDKNMRHSMGMAGLQRLRHKFDHLRLAEEAIRFYRRVIEEGKQRHAWDDAEVADVMMEFFAMETGFCSVGDPTLQKQIQNRMRSIGTPK